MEEGKPKPSLEAMQAAQELIDAEDEFVFDVAANHGQIFEYVRHMSWFIKAVAEMLEEEDIVGAAKDEHEQGCTDQKTIGE